MAIRISNIKLPINRDTESALYKEAAKNLKVSADKLSGLHIVKRSLDARKKDDIKYIYTVDVTFSNESKLLSHLKNPNVTKAVYRKYSFEPTGELPIQKRIVVVGAGPAGLFCAYKLAQWGYSPLLIERGDDVDSRTKAVEEFWATGKLDPSSNVQFGEGGAGTFSDGKLNTVVRDESGRITDVFKTFVKFGADEGILYKNKPHIGTDKLRKVVKGIRESITANGGEVRFRSMMTDVIFDPSGAIEAIEINKTERISCDVLVLAIGHSARDTFELLHSKSLSMEKKAFAMGVRVEHPQELISRSMYGDAWEQLPAADYKLTYKAKDGNGVYSFCMCPGGFVVNASSEEHRLVVNGMSNSGRDEAFANSALVVTVPTELFPGEDVLSGVELQRKIEADAYNLCDGAVPVQTYFDFRDDQTSSKDTIRLRRPNIKGQYSCGNIRSVLPEYIGTNIVEAMESFGRSIKGFDSEQALFIGVETRTSSPVRIVRDEFYESISAGGIYPCGEGAGYAGGITSAAVDGIKVAEAIASKYSNQIH